MSNASEAHMRNLGSRSWPAVFVALAVLVIALAAPAASARPAEPDRSGANVVLEVKFAESLQVRGADGSLHSNLGHSVAGLKATLARLHAQDVQPLVRGVTAQQLDTVAARARARSGRAVPDMASWYSLTLGADADVQRVLADLRARPEVAYAYPAPEPAPPPDSSATPDFTGLQGYFLPAPQGIDSDFSRADPRIRGAGIKIVDLEYDWNVNHEDLQL